jgi:tetraacyldisaccharide 4'-kinase
VAASTQQGAVSAVWYGTHPLSLLLAPLSWVYCAFIRLRRLAYTGGLARVHRLGIRVVVVGGITAGGTGKTPLVIWVARFLRAHGLKPGIVTRGYGGHARHWPQQVRADSDPDAVGDEAVLLARRSACPVAAGPRRVDAAHSLVRYAGCDVIVSDDGLQHLALGRDLEIGVLDGVRRFGNGRCLPAGPLREPPSRLGELDMVVVYGRGGRGEFSMGYVSLGLRSLLDERPRAPGIFADRPVHAVAGIGDPGRFFAQLRSLGLQVVEHPFADHHRYVSADLDFGDGHPVLMTEKDAVKCRRFAQANHWYLPVEVKLQEAFGIRLMALLQRKPHGQETA